MKVVLVVIDSFGVCEMPDADKFGDVGSNTYLNVLKKTNVDLKNMISLGLNNIDGINLSNKDTIGNYMRLQELTLAKDTTAGHYEMSGVIMEHPYPTFPNGFPDELLKLLKEKTGVEFIGNEVASGTEIIERRSEERR